MRVKDKPFYNKKLVFRKGALLFGGYVLFVVISMGLDQNIKLAVEESKARSAATYQTIKNKACMII